MSPVRSRWWLLVALALAVLLGLVYPFPLQGRFWSGAFDLAHGPVFCGVLLLVCGFPDPSSIGLSRFDSWYRIGPRELALAAIGTLVLGGAGEFLQTLSGRSPSVKDLLANSVGVFCGVLWVVAFRCRGVKRPALALTAVTLLLLAQWRPLLEVQGALRQQAEFPLLASFETPDDLRIWKLKHARIDTATEWKSQGTQSMRVRFRPAPFSSCSMIWPVPDWTGYTVLRGELYNPGTEPLNIAVKIFDHTHQLIGFPDRDRLEQDYQIPAGGTLSLVLPLSAIQAAPERRTMNLHEIHLLEFYTWQLSEPREVYIDNLRLTQESVPAEVMSADSQ